MKKENNMSN